MFEKFHISLLYIPITIYYSFFRHRADFQLAFIVEVEKVLE